MTDASFHFQTLMPDLILDAIESVGLRIDSGLTELNSYENRVYQFLDEDRQRWVVKFYRPERWSRAQILEEHEFSFELTALEIPVVAPSLFNGGSLHSYQNFMFAIFPSMGGRQYEMDNEEQLEWVGRFLGRIHQVGLQRPFVKRPTMGLNEYLYEPREILLQTELLPSSLRASFALALDSLIKTTQEYWRDDWLTCRLHGDCHPGNILWRDGPMFVDLDDARMGPAVQDMWMLLHGSRRDQSVQLDILLDAYSEFSDFNAQELSLIEPLRSMRMVYYLAWVVRRWQDSAFPKSFPWMLETSFWEQQISVFTEQVKLLRAPPLQLTPMY